METWNVISPNNTSYFQCNSRYQGETGESVGTGIARDAGALGSQAEAKEDDKTKKEDVGLVSQRQDLNLPGL